MAAEDEAQDGGISSSSGQESEGHGNHEAMGNHDDQCAAAASDLSLLHGRGEIREAAFQEAGVEGDEPRLRRKKADMGWSAIDALHEAVARVGRGQTPPGQDHGRLRISAHQLAGADKTHDQEEEEAQLEVLAISLLDVEILDPAYNPRSSYYCSIDPGFSGLCGGR